MPCRSFLFALLIAVTLNNYAYASMLDPDDDMGASDTSAPSSASSLKEKLDAARQAAGTPTAMPEPVADLPPAPSTTQDSVTPSPVTTSPVKHSIISSQPVIHKEVINAGILDDTKPTATATAPVQQTASASAQPVEQQIIRFDNTQIAAAPSDNMHDLLFDDAGTTPNTASNSADTEMMPAIPAVPVQNDTIAPPAPTKTSSVIPVVPDAFEKPAAMPEAPPQASPEAMPAPTMMPPPAIVDAPIIRSVVKPLAVPAVEIRKPPEAVSRFKPTPAKPSGEWVSHGMKPSAADKNDGLCLIQNRFDNNLVLVIGQNADGSVILGIDYGLEMLSTSKHYTAKVELDDSFSQDFPAYADGPEKLIVKLGVNPNFLAAMQSAETLHIGLQGTASTFALTNLSQGLQDFSKCLNDIHSAALPMASASVAPRQNVMPAVPVPVVQQENIAPTPMAAAAPQMNYSQTSNNDTPSGHWSDNTMATIRHAGLSTSGLQTQDTEIQWSAGSMHASAKLIPVADLVDASSLILDQQERLCGGQFSSQMGVPENRGSNNVLQMESKCVNASGTLVSTWTIVKDATGVTAWQMMAPRDQRGAAFDARQQLLTALSR